MQNVHESLINRAVNPGKNYHRNVHDMIHGIALFIKVVSVTNFERKFERVGTQEIVEMHSNFCEVEESTRVSQE